MQIDQQEEAIETVSSIANQFGLQPPANGSAVDSAYLTQLKDQAVNFASKIKQNQAIPSLLLTTPLSEQEWAKLEQYIEVLNADYTNRAALLKRRAEVTIDSFLWSDRVHKLESQIRDVVAASGIEHASIKPVYAEDLLAANTELLLVTKTSDAQFRRSTKSFVTDHRVSAKVVPDRGGRTDYMQPMQKESFQQQEMQRQQQQFRGGGGGGRGGGRGGGGNFQQQGGYGRGGGERLQGGGGGYGGGRGGGKRGRYN